MLLIFFISCGDEVAFVVFVKGNPVLLPFPPPEETAD